MNRHHDSADACPGAYACAGGYAVHDALPGYARVVNSSKIAVLWTGGKDSALALARCRETRGPVSYLVTFVPEGEVAFAAHPLERIKAQAAALGIEHLAIPIGEPYREGYIAALRELRERYAIGTVVTGDIDAVAGHPNWIRECCDAAGLDVLTPLWQNDRRALLEELLARSIVAEVTYIADGALPPEWLGRRIDHDFIRKAELLSRTTGIDICGENGEYHTMVCYGTPVRTSRAPQPSR